MLVSNIAIRCVHCISVTLFISNAFLFPYNVPINKIAYSK